MQTSRRGLLTCFGVIVTTVGGVFYSGAFRTVEAERTVSMETTGDASALLQFSGNEPEIIATESTGSAPSGAITLEQTTLNEEATTTYDAVLTVTNQGEKNVALSVDKSQGADPNRLVGTALDIRDSTGDSIVDDNSTAVVTLGANGGSETFSVVIDLRNYPTADMSSIDSIVFAARIEDLPTYVS